MAAADPDRAEWSDDGRFVRQARFAPIGEAGQARLGRASVLIVGCGALGGCAAQNLARAGVGRMVLADRDLVERSNLPRQVLFEEQDARARRPKVEAAASSLARVGGPTRVETHARHVDASALAELAADVDLILDGTDNLPTRYLINDFAVQRGLPWIYAGVVGANVLVMPVLPGRGACLRCLFPDPAPAGSLETCDTAGVVLPAVAAVAAHQSALALRWLTSDESQRADFPLCLTQLDLWDGRYSSIAVERDPGCPTCAEQRYDYLDTAELDEPTVLCGRNAVQLSAPPTRPDLRLLADRLRRSGVEAVEEGESLLRFSSDGLALTVFADGRAIVEGTEDPAVARVAYDRHLGS
jgi:molybdopterin/thiamine biosynthesis adenylyltransferase